MVSDERRSHVRGDVFFKLKFDLITREEYESLKKSDSKFFLHENDEKHFDNVNTDIDTDTALNADLIDFLLRIDEKLDRILDIISKDDNDHVLLNQGIGVNISGSGMSIKIEKPVDPGRIIHTNFILSRLPPVFIDAFGEVVRLTPVDEDGKTIYILGIKFLDLKLNQRESIISCVFQRHRKTIRKVKNEN